jgi:hypothetical protein
MSMPTPPVAPSVMRTRIQELLLGGDIRTAASELLGMLELQIGLEIDRDLEFCLAAVLLASAPQSIWPSE